MLAVSLVRKNQLIAQRFCTFQQHIQNSFCSIQELYLFVPFFVTAQLQLPQPVLCNHRTRNISSLQLYPKTVNRCYPAHFVTFLCNSLLEIFHSIMLPAVSFFFWFTELDKATAALERPTTIRVHLFHCSSFHKSIVALMKVNAIWKLFMGNSEEQRS